MKDTLRSVVAEAAEEETTCFLLMGLTLVLSETNITRKNILLITHQAQCCGNSGFHIKFYG